LTDTLTTERTIHPARNLLGTLRLPGDKSISHRYALLAGLAEGSSRFRNFSTGADCASSLACVRQLGAKVTRSGDTVEVEGSAGRLTPPGTVLDCGNSGSTMRMLTGLLAPQAGAFTLEGDASLNRRPMERVRKPLLEMGASIDLLDGHAPVRIQGGFLTPHRYPAPR
jgi:3-phosphoshikimate 1-carboxyvinyltransferase